MISQDPLGIPTPPVSNETAARLASDLFDLGAAGVVRAVPLPGEYDANFTIEVAGDARFVLKVMHPARERTLVELQAAALRHLSRTAPELSLPVVQATRAGDLLTTRPVPTAGESQPADRIIWMLSFMDGVPYAEARPQKDAMRLSLGSFLGALDKGLADFAHPAAERDFKWDLSRAGWIEGSFHQIIDPGPRALVEAALAMYKARVLQALPDLRRSVIHSDANDYNVLVDPATAEPREVRSVIDFGDMHLGLTVAEVAVGAAYALLGVQHPLTAAAQVVRGYHAVYPLKESEVEVVFPLILARLAVSVTNSAIARTIRPDDPYVTISEAPAWSALERLMRVSPDLAHATLRQACGFPVTRGGEGIVPWIEANARRAAPVLDLDLRTGPSLVFDLSVGSTLLGADPAATETSALTGLLFGEMAKAGVSVGVGRYDEARLLYVSPLFGHEESPLDERRTIHLGIDLFVEPGSRVRAPLEGVVHLLANNDAPQDYGPLVILRHAPDDGTAFFTLYGHLSPDTLDGLKDGQILKAGEAFARVGSPPGNGDWAPHLHFQIILDLLGLGRDFPGVCRASERSFWTEVSPDPNLLLGIPHDRFGERPPDPEATLAQRLRRIGRNVGVSYQRPLKIVRGFGSYLYDETGRGFLDMYNNVPLVGHSHPRVVRAIQAQVGLLNTNTRYLHDNIVRYAERLTALLPPPLRVCFFVNSGSEANELALRIARTHTARQDVMVLEHAYHGHTQALIDISPYKFDGRGGEGRKPWVHVAPMPDDYRGPYRRDHPQAGLKYGRDVGTLIAKMTQAGSPPAAFIAEPLPSVGGQIVPPPGYLAEAYRHVREAGGLCVADEVQVGFGRLGTHMWGFEMQDVTPDIVVLGKPIGNGFPLAAVITTEAIARSFDNGMEFFSTFGGNPVACAAGLAVLDVLRDEGLQARALEVGNHLRAGLRSLMDRYPLIGDVRGSGLFVGVDLVRDRATREPASAQANYLVNRLRDRGVLAGTDGPGRNVIKLRPPLVLSGGEADLFLAVIRDLLSEDGVQP